VFTERLQWTGLNGNEYSHPSTFAGVSFQDPDGKRIAVNNSLSFPTKQFFGLNF